MYQKHLHGEFRTELRDSHCALADCRLSLPGSPPVHWYSGTRLHYLGIVQRDLGRIDARREIPEAYGSW